MTRPIQPGLSRNVPASMPSLGQFKFPLDDPWYVVMKPGIGGRYKVDPVDGTALLVDTRDYRWVAMLVSITILVPIVGIAALNAAGPTFGSVFGSVMAAIACGCVVGFVVGAAINDRIAHRPPKPSRQVPTRTVACRVDKYGSSRAWKVCELAAATAATRAWSDRTVDADRRVPEIVWSTVHRSLSTDDTHRDAVKAMNHETLRDMAKRTLARVEQERKSLDVIIENLQAVLDTSRKIDARRAKTAAELEADRRRRAEEAELRRRLTVNDTSAADAWVSEDHADQAAGLAAEVEYVAEVLNRSDALLRAPTPGSDGG